MINLFSLSNLSGGSSDITSEPNTSDTFAVVLAKSMAQCWYKSECHFLPVSVRTDTLTLDMPAYLHSLIRDFRTSALLDLSLRQPLNACYKNIKPHVNVLIISRARTLISISKRSALVP